MPSSKTMAKRSNHCTTKAQKDFSKLANVRPISLLPLALKLFERLVYNRITIIVVDPLLIDEQPGLRTGVNTKGQILIMCPYLEDEFERKRMVGAISIDLRAAYDSVNKRFHHLLVRFLNRQFADETK